MGGGAAPTTARLGTRTHPGGAAGVLYALHHAAGVHYDRGEQWLLDHTATPQPDAPAGLYTGLSGVALVLEHLGHRGRALDVIAHVLAGPWRQTGPGLHGGLPGIGLVLDDLATSTGESALRAAAAEIATLLAQDTPGQLTSPDGTSTPGRPGLMHGATGTALFFLHHYDHTHDPALLDHAARALQQDLDRCLHTSSGALHTGDGTRSLPYLRTGSVGIGMVLDDYLTHRHDATFARARDAIALAARSRVYAQSGLFDGRAGMLLYLARTSTPTVSPRHLADQVHALAWHAINHHGHLAFPGNQLMRLSADLATGTAGCLLALAAASGFPAHLPFLPPVRTRHEPAGAPSRAPAPTTGC
ncbi:lanthionine synthetase LanC family protein [Streptomyces sp. Rer75]|uniref:lanthionine synthetase LanC family protein n=1 Tax=Streptomyces sp. Rer75 TaxID=2750011 RepID=UPI0015D0AFFB|nr:lanthionine synthetase LanC family protein [Streptomyces sp. Rer75]QLH19469.1 lanthionine synthetase C family protein [Streptomyces sp. Rer75]